MKEELELMKIYFGVCGIGLGHAARCVPIAHKLKEMGNKVVFSTYKDAIDYIKNESLPYVESPSIDFAVKPSGEIDFRQTTANPGPFSIYIFLQQVMAEIQFMKVFKPDLVVSDSRISPIFAAKLLDVPRITILNSYRVFIPRKDRFLNLARIADGGILTVVGKTWSLGKYVLIPDFPPPYTISANNLTIPPSRLQKIIFIGPILGIRPENLPAKVKLKEKLGLEIDLPTIFATISGPIKEKTYLINLLKRQLKQIADSDEYQIVMSLGNPNTIEKPKLEDNIMIYDWVPNRFEFMKASDLVIARAGLGTITDSICFGKPQILIPTPSHTEQFFNAKRAEKLGVAKTLEQDNLNSKTLHSTVHKMLDKQFLEKTKEIQKEVSKYKALDTAINIMTNLVT